MRTRDGRAHRKAERQSEKLGLNPAYRLLKNPFTPHELWSEDRIAAIHEAALVILEDLGVRVLLDEARQIFAKAGAIIDDDMMVRIGRDMVEDALNAAPNSIPMNSPTPDRRIVFEQGALMFGAGAGCPNATDRERGRRPGSLRDYRETIKLQHSFDAIHKLSPCAEPQDIPVHFRHYEMMRALLTLSDKTSFIYSRGRGQIEDCFELIRLARGLTEDEFKNNAWVTTVINTNSPRQIDKPMAQGIIDFARAGQVSVITPFCLAGAMAPITVAGALTLQHAEALIGITLAQLSRPGAPVLYGAFSSNVDMKSGAPAFGTPAHIQACLGSGQLARHIDLPWRSASGSASNAADAQGAQETALSLWGAMMAGATTIFHSAGWLEGGLTFGYEKFIVDMEAVQTLAELCIEPASDPAAIALDAIAEVQPGGHFFGAAHTMERYEKAFYKPIVADLSNNGAWVEAGAKTAEERATAVWKRVLSDYEPPKVCGGVEDAIAPFIERRTKEGGAAPLD
jgi:trimethylamine--corrinoid protein Co-methyltransferase